jgi:AcrR family transcriptional regulator
MLVDSPKASSSYHHGNVKEALLLAAENYIDKNDGEMISLRGLSKEVGVTPSAVYNHFDDKNSLMLAIKLRIYKAFNDFFAENSTDASDPEQALLEMCLAYFHFSRQHPSQFRFLFSSSLPMEWSTEEIVDVSCQCIAKARSLVFSIYQKYQSQCAEDEVVNTTLLIWSQLHGIVVLRNSGLIGAEVNHQNWPGACALRDDAQVENLIEDHVQIMINGMLSSARGQSKH